MVKEVDQPPGAAEPSEVDAPHAPRKPALVGPAALIVLMTLAAYGRSLGNGFIWDDPDYVINNATLRSLFGLWEMWTRPSSLPQWYPLTHTTFWVEYHLWGLWPPGYHIVNTLLHAANAVLLWRLLARLNVPGGWLAGAVFAVHPVMVESVAWITERKNVLSCCFYLSAGIVYLRSGLFDRNRDGSMPRCDWRFYGVSFLLFACALFSKTVTASLPAAILVLIWWKHGRVRRSDVTPLLPFFVLGMILATVTATIEHDQVGARAQIVPELDLSPAQRVLIAGRVIPFYAWKLFSPTNLMFIYPRWEIDPQSLRQWLFPAGVLALVSGLAVLTFTRGISRGPLAVSLLFVGALFPALGFVNVYPMRFSFVADHFQYHASICLLSGLCAGFVTFSRRARLSDATIRTLSAPVLAVLLVLTFRQTDRYLDAETLWRTTSQENPNSWMVWTNLGNALAKLERYDEAIPHYERALKLAPHLHETWWNAGVSCMRQGRLDEAEARFNRSKEINPRFAPAYDSLGKLYYFRRKDPARAEAFYREALKHSKDSSAEANFDLAVLLDQTGRTEAALDHYRRAVAAQTDYIEAHEFLGAALFKLKQYDEAIYNLNEAVRIEPENVEARINLASALLLAGHRDAAAVQFRIALDQRPGDPRALRGLQGAAQ